MKDTIDNMIEDWAAARTRSVRASLAPLQGFEGFTLTPEVPPDTPATPLDAAQAIREAVVTKTTGKRPSVNRWRPVAAKVLGFKRLRQKRWQAVLDAGVEAGLFVIDSDTLSYPILVAADPAPDPEPAADPAPVPAPVPAADPEPAAVWPPADYVAPVTFRCGHSNHAGHGISVDDPKQVEARAEDYCCEAQRAETRTYRRLNQVGSSDRKATPHVDWRVRGLYEPVPVAMRRSPERDKAGWPGVCCDPESGLYIGGVGNDCRTQGSERCVVHVPQKRERPS